MALVRRRDYLRWALHSIYTNAHNKVLHYKTVDVDGRVVESYVDTRDKWRSESSMHLPREIHEAALERHLLGVAYSQQQSTVVETSPKLSGRAAPMPLERHAEWAPSALNSLRMGLSLPRLDPSGFKPARGEGDLNEATTGRIPAVEGTVCA